MSMRKVCAACLTALFAAGTATALQAADAATTAPSTFKPGTYTATVNGHNAPVTVKVTVSKNLRTASKRSTRPRTLKQSA